MGNLGHAPIPTLYNGTLFRSRLEARWAVFFDQIGLDWYYEPVKWVNGSIEYTPDFHVGGLHCKDAKRTDSGGGMTVEIKPTKPNKSYVEYLLSVRDPKRDLLLVLIGEPNLYQPEGMIIHSDVLNGGNVITNGVSARRCPICGIYWLYEISWIDEWVDSEPPPYGHELEAFGHYHPYVESRLPNKAIEVAKYYRFDL